MILLGLNFLLIFVMTLASTLGPSWVVLGRLGGLLGASWAHLGAFWSCLGGILARLGGVLGLRTVLGSSWDRFGNVLVPFWDRFGLILGR